MHMPNHLACVGLFMMILGCLGKNLVDTTYMMITNISNMTKLV